MEVTALPFRDAVGRRTLRVCRRMRDAVGCISSPRFRVCVCFGCGGECEREGVLRRFVDVVARRESALSLPLRDGIRSLASRLCDSVGWLSSESCELSSLPRRFSLSSS